MRKLNLGCGHVQPKGWVNVDGSNRAWLASRLSWLDRLLVKLRLFPPTEFNSSTRYADLTKRLPWADNSVDCIYMGEVLEHFTHEDGLRLLAECHRVLKPEGTIRLRVPDNARFWRNYIKEYDEIVSRPREQWSSEHSRWVAMFFRDICVRRIWFKSIGHFHKWMYDDVSLIRDLEQVGFVSASRRPFLESGIPDVGEVETRDDLIVEGAKPPAG